MFYFFLNVDTTKNEERVKGLYLLQTVLLLSFPS